MKIIESPSRNEEKVNLPAPPPTGVVAAEAQADKKSVRTDSVVTKIFMEGVLDNSISLILIGYTEPWLIVPRLEANKSPYCSSF